MYAKSLQSCPTLCDPMDWVAHQLICSWGPPGKTTGVGCHQLICSWGPPGKNAGAGCHALLREIFPPGSRTLVSYVSCIGRQVGSLPPAPPGKPTYWQKKDFSRNRNIFGIKKPKVQFPSLWCWACNWTFPEIWISHPWNFVEKLDAVMDQTLLRKCFAWRTTDK